MGMKNWHYLLLITLTLTFITIVRAKELTGIVAIMLAVTIFSFLLENRNGNGEQKNY